MNLAEAMALTVSTVAARTAGTSSRHSSGPSLDLNIADAIADLNTIDLAIHGQMQRIIFDAARRYEAMARAATPVSTVKKARHQRLSTGWQSRPVTVLRVHVANIRPHAHLAAEGWNHVGGRHIPPFVPWIADAMRVRDQMVDDIEQLVHGGFPTALRALEVTP